MKRRKLSNRLQLILMISGAAAIATALYLSDSSSPDEVGEERSAQAKAPVAREPAKAPAMRPDDVTATTPERRVDFPVAQVEQSAEPVSYDEAARRAERTARAALRRDAPGFVREAEEWRAVEIATFETFVVGSDLEADVRFYVEFSGRTDQQYFATLRYAADGSNGELIALERISHLAVP